MSTRRSKSPEDENKRRAELQHRIRFSIGYMLAGVIVVWLFQELVAFAIARSTEISYSDFKSKLAAGEVVEVSIRQDHIQGTLKNPKPSPDAPATIPFRVQLAGGHWEIAATRLDATDLRVEILAGGGERATGGSPNLGFLDAIDGELEVAVTIDARVPVLGGVAATRRFHIRIQDGSIDYRAHEHALPWVEDALLDFVLHGDRLVLQTHLPPGSGDEKELLAWPLDDEGVALARAGRLRTLPFFMRRRREKKRAGHCNAVAIRGVDIEIARTDLRFAEAPTIAIGSRVRVRLGDGATAMVSRGAIRHRPDGHGSGSSCSSRRADRRGYARPATLTRFLLAHLRSVQMVVHRLLRGSACELPGTIA